MRHYGDYWLPLCGAEIFVELRVEYSWAPLRGATMWEPAEGGAEIEKVEALIGDDRYELPDWPDEVDRAIKINIARERRMYEEEYEEVEA